MNFPVYSPSGGPSHQVMKRRGERGAVGPGRPLVLTGERRKSKVWNYFNQRHENFVECNICKKQLSFHNSTTSLREHLVRRHFIGGLAHTEGAPPPPHNAVLPEPPALQPSVGQGSFHSSRLPACNTTGNTGAFQTVMPVMVKEEQHDAEIPPEAVEAKRARPACAPACSGGSSLNANLIPNQELEGTAPGYRAPPEDVPTSGDGSSTRGCSNKRAGIVTDLILEMVFRDLQPLSVVKEKGFKVLLGCLEPHYPVPPPSLLGRLLWHRYSIFKQCLQQHLQTGLASRCLALCTERWLSVEGCGVGGGGRSYLTVSAHFIDSDWRLARCVLQTRPIPAFKRQTPERGCAQLGDTLKAVLSEFQLPESYVFCVLYDSLLGAASSKHCGSEVRQECQPTAFAGPSSSPPQKLPEGWVALHCAGEALKLCVQEGLCVEPVMQALADARGIVLHFQHDLSAAEALSQKADAANKGAVRLVLDNPGRWATAIDMCESLLELKWMVSSVLEEQRVASNLADHQWRLLQELVPVLRTVRIAASFLSEPVNAPISALMPCLQGVGRLLGQSIAECKCPVVKGVMERVRAGMEKRWRLSDEDSLLKSPAVLSSFLDPRFKELRFLSPHVRSKLHDKVKELLSAQDYADDREVGQEGRMETDDIEEGGRGDPVLGLDDPLSVPTMASLDSPESSGSAEEGDIIELRESRTSVELTLPEQTNNEMDGLSTCKTTSAYKGPLSLANVSTPQRGDQQLSNLVQIGPVPQSMYDILLGEDPTERMPEIHQQLENYIAEPLCKRSLSPLHWWRTKEHRFPAVARLARKYLAIPATAIPGERAFAPRESSAAQRRATLGPQYLDPILFLHQNCDYLEQLRGGSMGHREGDHNSCVSGNQSRESLYQTLVSYESKALRNVVTEEEL